MSSEIIEVTVNQSKLRAVSGDITRQATDAIVNAANSGLMGGGGVDGAIHRAGGPAILEECKQIVARQGRLPTGRAVITTGGNLPAKHVIHTVGPRNGNASKVFIDPSIEIVVGSVQYLFIRHAVSVVIYEIAQHKRR